MKFQTKIAKHLINRQASLWSYLREKELFKKSEEKKYRFCIAISRETGSGGRLVAKLVAKKLRLKYYDKRIVNLIVKETKKRKGLIKSLDEKSRSFMEETIGAIFGAEMVSASIYFRHLVKVLLTLSQKKNCLILGRGANFILPAKSTLRVRIIAPLKKRVASSVKYEGRKKGEARELIKKTHFDRKNFIKRYFKKDISNANYYDLVINTKDFSLEEVVMIIVTAFKEKFPKRS